MMTVSEVREMSVMTNIYVQYIHTTDALGNIRDGWSVVEDGRPGYPYNTQEKAESAAEAIRKIRFASR